MNESLSRALRLLRLSGMAETLEDFDWSSNTSVKRTEIFDLATCRFTQEVHDVRPAGRWQEPPLPRPRRFSSALFNTPTSSQSSARAIASARNDLLERPKRRR